MPETELSATNNARLRDLQRLVDQGVLSDVKFINGGRRFEVSAPFNGAQARHIWNGSEIDALLWGIAFAQNADEPEPVPGMVWVRGHWRRTDTPESQHADL